MEGNKIKILLSDGQTQSHILPPDDPDFGLMMNVSDSGDLLIYEGHGRTEVKWLTAVYGAGYWREAHWVHEGKES